LSRLRHAYTAVATAGLILVVLCPVLFIVQMSLRTGLEAFQMPPAFAFSATLQN
jgi:ABC-type glycerol-3-phosphate transport system permease component